MFQEMKKKEIFIMAISLIALFELGILYLEIGKIQEAKRKLKSALSNFKKIEAKQLVKKVNHLLSQIEKQ